MTPNQPAPFSSDMPECELSIICHSAERTRVIGDLVTSPNHTHTAHPWKLLGVMGLSAEHGFNAPHDIYSHIEVEEMFGKGELCIKASHRCVASVAVLPGDFPPQSALRRADIVCLGPCSHPFQEFGHNHRRLICNICHCSVVMQQSPRAHGTMSLQ